MLTAENSEVKKYVDAKTAGIKELRRTIAFLYSCILCGETLTEEEEKEIRDILKRR